MPPRIAIPMPHSIDHAYAARAIPQYEHAVEQAGAEAVRIRLDQSDAEVRKIIERCDGVLLPGSNADVDPARFNADRSPRTAAADPRRDAVDVLLLEDAYNLRKPILGICYGLQNLNVYRAGSLIQHIPDFLPENLRTRVNHEAGKKVTVAHAVEIETDSKLAAIVAHSRKSSNKVSPGENRERQDRERHDRKRQDWKGQNREGHDREGYDFSRANSDAKGNGALAPEGKLIVPVNSSHHQSADAIGNSLCISARCPDDGIIEALEGTAADHFVLAVQWHPERSVNEDEASRAIFRALIEAVKTRRK